MLSVSHNGKINLTRGDTARLTVSIQNDFSGEPYAIKENDTLVLTVKKYVSDRKFCFQKKIVGCSEFYIEPQDTSNLEFGTYQYDVQLETENGEIYTVCGVSEFEILKEVTC